MREAENQLLAIALDPEQTDLVFTRIQASEFSGETEAAIAGEIEQMREQNRRVDLLTLAEALERRGWASPFNELIPLSETGSLTSTLALVDDYVAMVKRESLRNRLRLTLTNAVRALESDQPESVVAELNDKISDLSGAGDDDGIWTMQKATKDYLHELERRFDSGGGLIGLSTGFDALDARTGGLRGGDLVIVAGRPGTGKTTLALNMAEACGINGAPVLISSMEMAAAQLTEKFVSAGAEIPMGVLRNGQLESEHWSRLTNGVHRLKNLPVMIDDRAGQTVPGIRARAHQVRQQHGLDIIIVDYIGLMQGEGENRTQQLTRISAGLKRLARELDVPVVALSQLNREVEKRANKRPGMADLRESGALEQDADMIFFTYRDEYYNPDSAHKGLAEIICAKQRMGETGTDYLAWQGHYSRFVTLDGPPPPLEEDAPTKTRGPRSMDL